MGIRKISSIKIIRGSVKSKTAQPISKILTFEEKLSKQLENISIPPISQRLHGWKLTKKDFVSLVSAMLSKSLYGPNDWKQENIILTTPGRFDSNVSKKNIIPIMVYKKGSKKESKIQMDIHYEIVPDTVSYIRKINMSADNIKMIKEVPEEILKAKTTVDPYKDLTPEDEKNFTELLDHFKTNKTPIDISGKFPRPIYGNLSMWAAEADIKDYLRRTVFKGQGTSKEITDGQYDLQDKIIKINDDVTEIKVLAFRKYQKAKTSTLYTLRYTKDSAKRYWNMELIDCQLYKKPRAKKQP